jgi:adenosylcobyric acid synthase
MNTFEHGGNIHKILRDSPGKDQEILDFSANINPLGPPEWFRPLISSQLENLIHYPDPENTSFIKAIAEHTGISTEHIIVGNGTTELLYAFMQVLPCKRALIPVPSYVDYARAAKIAGLAVENIILQEKDDFILDLKALSSKVKPGDLVIIATPNNPTGKTVNRAELLSVIKDFPQSYFLIDEAFLDFIEGGKTIGGELPNILTINSMTKFYGVPGLRIGYGILSPALVLQVKENLPPWTVNTLAQAIGTEALKDTAYQLKTRQVCLQLRLEMETELQKIHQ